MTNFIRDWASLSEAQVILARYQTRQRRLAEAIRRACANTFISRQNLTRYTFTDGSYLEFKK